MSSNSEEADQNPYQPSKSPPSSASAGGHRRPEDYWSSSLKVVGVILFVWAFISLGCGVLFRDLLDSMVPNIGGAPFGFWMAQQGSIIGFLILLFVYMILMNWLDHDYGFDEKDKQ